MDWRHSIFLIGLQPGLCILYAFSLFKFTCVTLATEAGVVTKNSSLQLLLSKCSKSKWKIWSLTWCPAIELSCKIAWHLSLMEPWTVAINCFKSHGVVLGSARPGCSYIFHFVCSIWLYLQDVTMPNLISINASPMKCIPWYTLETNCSL